jgi:FkbM family methyltransferase
MKETLKRLASRLPLRHQQWLKRIHFGRQIRKGTFKTGEREFARLAEWVGDGDWVLDIGANVGHYTGRLSELVGASGRVIAFEPVPQTFELLAANAALFPSRNVTLLNVAASETTEVVGISIPMFETGLENYYVAHLVREGAELQVLCLTVDSLNIPRPVSLSKIDVEGHELSVLKGMENLIRRDYPVLIVEGRDAEVASYLESFGYVFEEAEGSPNRVFKYAGDAASSREESH